MKRFFKPTVVVCLTLFASSLFAQDRNQIACVIWHMYGDVAPLKPVYKEVTAVCDFGALTKVAIANTSIVSALVDTADGRCNVTAIVNHPPANDSVKVWIALPLKGWNGRFQGVGGGGFVGGDPLMQPIDIS